jgi:AcrR family transcriptional regulator
VIPGEPSPAAGKPLRADARRNRALVLETAEAVFAAKGISASTEEIARRAGVGVGTVFRHFPTKEALLEAIIIGRLRRLAGEADSLAAADDPGAAFFAFFTQAVGQSATKIAFVDALAGAGVDVDNAISQVGQDLHRALDRLLARAQHAGAVRDDVGVTEVIALLAGISRAAEQAAWDDTTTTRTLTIVFDGLRHVAGKPSGSASP